MFKSSKLKLLNFGLVAGLTLVALCMFFAPQSVREGADAVTLNCEGLSVGEYVTSDNAHTITVSSDTVMFDDAYSLTSSESGGTTQLTGTLGTSNTAVTFVQLNDNALVCVSHIKYTTSAGTNILYMYTPFVKTFTPTLDTSGVIEVWRNSAKVATFSDFQSAFTYANNGDIVKLTNNLVVQSGAVLVGKSVTIDGGGYTLDKSQWASTVFAVADNAQLTINNLNINGYATGWEVDFDAVTYTDYSIPLVSGSADSDPVSNYPVITSSGELYSSYLNVRNIYSTTSGAVLAVTKGEVQIADSSFTHCLGSGGGAFRIGYSILEDNATSLPISCVELNNVDFIGNYSNGAGGAINALSAKNFVIKNSTFDNNVANGNSGGALYVGGFNNNAIDYPEYTVQNSNFIYNWAGNDGFAIENNMAKVTLTSTNFIGNVGPHPTSSVGTYSTILARTGTYATQTFYNCLFEKNNGPTSCIGDHGSCVIYNVTNTIFRENEGITTILFYTGIATFENCSFTNDKSTRNVVDLRPNDTSAYYEGSGVTTATLTIRDTTFENSLSGVDVDVRSDNHSNTTLVEGEVVIEGETQADIQLKEESKLTVTGSLDGTVTLDEYTSEEDNVTVEDNGGIAGEIVRYFTLTINYKDASEQDVSATISVANGSTSYYEIESLLGVTKVNYTLVLYTDSGHTALWDLVCDTSETLYGAWEWSVAINYYDNGGIQFSGTHATAFAQNHLNGTTTILDAPTKAGYVFEGWFLNDATCAIGSKITQLSADIEYSSIALYAKWSELVTTITLNCQNFTAQQYMVYVFVDDECVLQMQPLAQNTTLTFNRVQNYNSALRICFVFGYNGQVAFSSLDGATASGRTVVVDLVTTVQINYTIVTPQINSSLIV